MRALGHGQCDSLLLLARKQSYAEGLSSWRWSTEMSNHQKISVLEKYVFLTSSMTKVIIKKKVCRALLSVVPNTWRNWNSVIGFIQKFWAAGSHVQYWIVIFDVWKMHLRESLALTDMRVIYP